ncbi:MAG: FGGY-family carbohydrate kinase, partial [Anaerolineales bacterium]
GASLQWAWRTLFPPDMSFEHAVKTALQSPPGAHKLIFLPFLSGERSPYWSDDLRGAFYGLNLSHTIYDMLRSVMEGVAFSLRYLLTIYDELGIKVDEIALAGGGVNTPGWSQIIADVCHLPVSVFCGEDTVTRALYAYICQALDSTPDAFKPALLRTFGSANMVLPQLGVEKVYDLLFERYRRLADFLHQHFSKG